jgi:predicted alpha-1,2-mannosidase
VRSWFTAFAVLLFTAVPASADTLVSRVDTRVGTDEVAPDFGTGGGAGATFPGAVAPFGMLQVSPDTHPGIRNYAGGYSYRDTQIKGFSLTHISGAGCSALGDVPILPTVAPVDVSPSKALSYDVDERYVSSFAHEGEVATPGDYRVNLSNQGKPIGVEATATQRAGALRFSFPAGTDGSVLVNAGGSSMGNDISDLTVDPARQEISGTIESGQFCSGFDSYRIHFVARFDRPFTASGTWTRQLLQPGATRTTDKALTDHPGILTLQYKRTAGLPDEVAGHPTQGAQAGAYATFGGGGPVTANVAISSVDVEGARKNLGAPPAFDALRSAAVKAWETQLGKVRVDGGTPSQRSLLSTALYHALIHPTLYSDTDGRYRGMDGQIHEAKGWDKYVNVSGWDTYRAQLPLMAMLEPRVTSHFVTSLISDWRESGHLPKWSLREGHTNVMVGDPADLLIAGAHAFGARDFDAKTALRAMVDGATKPGVSPNASYVQRAGLDDYAERGWVGYEQNGTAVHQAVDPKKVWGTASTSLEYALADFGIARLARAVGARETCTTFAGRAANWRRSFDPQTGVMRPRKRDGSFVRSHAVTSQDGFVEGSAAQYTWFVPQDVAGLVKALGGRKAALRKLDTFMAKLNDGPESIHAFLGNEPTLHTPYLYDWLGTPGRGARAVRTAMLRLYKMTPGGFPGNDDLGSMSAWWVFGALGLHPTTPGTGDLTFGAPLFKRARVKLDRGTLDIRAPRAAADNVYVRGVKLDRKPLSRTWLTWERIAKGANLTVDLKAKPTSWGRSAQAAPPSYLGRGACR